MGNGESVSRANLPPAEVIKTDEEWKSQLTPQEYDVCRRAGTEAPFTGQYNKFYKNGLYKCVCCEAPLFESDTKFDSGTGWPSFNQAKKDSVIEITDNSIPLMSRTEVVCSKCHAHLGHVFNDGPNPTDVKY
ncbi:hypothetical protein AKO1_005556 [Acrasis kona]|uniref:Peptide-methionine (R)-S-oxide reductase n=1 Tax=Acrasis kona TaxID=1008807 RepID=A0AAW2YL44_9EUKA